MLVATSTTVNISAATATVGLFALSYALPTSEQLKMSLILFGWVASPYLALLIVTMRWRRSTMASIVVTLGTLIIAGGSGFLLYGMLGPHIGGSPADTTPAIGDRAPIELGVPAVQWIAVIVVAISARLTNALTSVFWPSERKIIVKAKRAAPT